ncbi:MAG TPA: peptide chain release factor N(5)-glutamine methyltransferase [Acidimicrobiales bacterium]|nr:peptide chain release factor N(5)-glutamine methyltransferase [Acidimicrobiales bacterium]
MAAATDLLGSAQEARWLAEAAAKTDWPALLDEAVTERTGEWFDRRVARRALGEPLQYVLGRWGFRRLDLFVDRRVLIPRPETEAVVEVALGELDRQGPVDQSVAADLGTGSGAIALSLAVERPGLTVVATDASEPALNVARANLAGVGGRAATRVSLRLGSWWEALPADLEGRLALAVSNPPYVSEAEMVELDPVVADWEPRSALAAGSDGLDDIRVIVAGAARWLRPGGALVVELAPHQAATAVELAGAAGLTDARVAPDLAGRDRALVARRRTDR